MYMCGRTYLYVNIHTCMRVHTYTHTCTTVDASLCVYMHVHVYGCMSAYLPRYKLFSFCVAHSIARMIIWVHPPSTPHRVASFGAIGCNGLSTGIVNSQG